MESTRTESKSSSVALIYQGNDANPSAKFTSCQVCLMKRAHLTFWCTHTWYMGACGGLDKCIHLVLRVSICLFSMTFVLRVSLGLYTWLENREKTLIFLHKPDPTREKSGNPMELNKLHNSFNIHTGTKPSSYIKRLRVLACFQNIYFVQFYDVRTNDANKGQRVRYRKSSKYSRKI